MDAIAPRPIPSFRGPAGQEDMPYLLTPGPLTTSRTVKAAMLADWGSRDIEFRRVVAEIREGLLGLANCGPDYECVIMQGSGTFAIEAALGSFCPSKGVKTLVVANGAYGDRAAKILERLGRPHVKIDKGDSAAPSVEDVTRALDADPSISHVWIIHCETTSGVVNPIEDVARAVKAGVTMTRGSASPWELTKPSLSGAHAQSVRSSRSAAGAGLAVLCLSRAWLGAPSCRSKASS